MPRRRAARAQASSSGLNVTAVAMADCGCNRCRPQAPVAWTSRAGFQVGATLAPNAPLDHLPKPGVAMSRRLRKSRVRAVLRRASAAQAATRRRPRPRVTPDPWFERLHQLMPRTPLRRAHGRTRFAALSLPLDVKPACRNAVLSAVKPCQAGDPVGPHRSRTWRRRQRHGGTSRGQRSIRVPPTGFEPAPPA